MKSALLVLLLALLAACERKNHGFSSVSVADARRAGVRTAEYVVPANADLGRYRPVEVWIEHGDHLVVRLNGPHVDTEPRVRIQGLAETDYRAIWSVRDGPPYEVWTAPDPLPDTLILERDSTKIELHKRTE